ncbi:restriction endonuclease subunit S [Vibrio ostreicida]|uniref:Restriction endonuclease subunit S n=1 Tax=Vibrio ostreicida TaxID=526588 RepID=A0ABT8BRS9_9VIBR|nr:restriction endonuclease subunit S [Vibrio ostreicida]MDN3609369.1 restriction endonuclease subunit S [Vibrio ostreicida]NPD08259.1 restriction endonuclease subunit S [Vibrio ostreicida]
MSFKTYTLGEIASNTSRRFNFVGNEQVCFINTGDILDGHFLTDERVQSKGLPGQAKKAIQHGDILYSEIRPGNKRHLLVEGDVDDYVVSTKFMVITCDHDVVLPEFLYLVLTSKECEAEFKVIADSRSGTFPQITFDAVAYYPIELPSLNEQRKVVEIIKSITQKLNLNKDINSTSEDIAQALFKSWFVDFDPVKAKMNGEKPEGMDAATASLFPEKLVESEEGLIPEGWNVEPLKNVSRVINGRAYKNTEFKDEGTPIIRIQNLTGKGKTVYSDMELPKDKLTEHGDLLFAWSATFGPHLWRGPKSIYHYHIWKMDVDETKFGKYLLYLHLARLTDYLKNQGTGSIFTHLTKAIMESQKLIVPSEAIVEEFSKVVTPLFAQIDSLHKENKVLEQLRDTLLPKLLSGEIELETTEELVEVN